MLSIFQAIFVIFQFELQKRNFYLPESDTKLWNKLYTRLFLMKTKFMQ